LRQFGPTPEAFTFKQLFPPPDAADASAERTPISFEDPCPAT
jgi:hypothetical protein